MNEHTLHNVRSLKKSKELILDVTVWKLVHANIGKGIILGLIIT